MRTNLAERRIGYEPPEVPEGESLEERRERIRAIYQWRKAMRRLARLGCIWLSGVGFALCIIAGQRQAACDAEASAQHRQHGHCGGARYGYDPRGGLCS